jgi:hypothetical protein
MIDNFFNPKHQFLRFFGVDHPSERFSEVRVLGRVEIGKLFDTVSFQFATRSAGGRTMAEVFWKRYVPATTPTQLELDALQEEIEGSFLAGVSYLSYRHEDGFLFGNPSMYDIQWVNLSKMVIFAKSIFDWRTVYTAPAGLYTIQVRARMPAVIWAGAESFANTPLMLLESERIKVVYDILDVESEYFTRIAYRNGSNAFGFVYEGQSAPAVGNLQFTNVLRLPLQLLRPQYKTVTETYKDSAGRLAIVSAEVNKEYELQTSQVDSYFLECLANALVHEQFELNDVSYVQVEGMEISWVNLPRPELGRGVTKVQESPYDSSSPYFI